MASNESTPLQRRLSFNQVDVANSDPQRGFILNLFSMVSVLTIISSVFVCFAQFISITYKIFLVSFGINQLTFWDLFNARDVLQCYGIIFSFGIILNELDYELTKSLRLMQNWIYRGFMYIFVGLLTFDDYLFPTWTIVMQASGYCLMTMGILYIIMVGLLQNI